MSDLLISEEAYRNSAIHIGTKIRSADMKRFTAYVNKEGLNILDIKKIDERIKVAAKFLSKYDPSGIVFVASREYAKKPVKAAAAAISAKALTERFIPGSFTNPDIPLYTEPDVIVVNDPATDSQALREAVANGVPVVALCHTNNSTSFVDLVLPGNNKGRESLALIYYLLTKEILKLKEKDTSQIKQEDFLAEL
ncbi:MAG: 30S ribosomal protein S2 [Candidatus Thermoplasmatota archaeon]|jgi:small subunit ribosomal protein S2|nr:30S ribosomal protein S2 [Candidatus Thermoplasmatota archaeon]MCL5680527.1 30S ribosomal protein S2 [Candidatus Thermoplasmatota archaeon]